MSMSSISIQTCDALRWSDATATEAMREIGLFRLRSEEPDLGAMIPADSLLTDYLFLGSSETPPTQAPFMSDTITDRLS